MHTIQTTVDNIKKDLNVYGDNVYLGNGQGCDTIWFKTVPQARKALERDGIKTGHDLCDCSKCGCHYSFQSPGWKKYPQHACSAAKEEYANQFR